MEKEENENNNNIEEPIKHYLTSKEFENLDKNIDVIVIGSGIGGMTTAALLAKAGGLRVILLEKHKTLGGCTHTFKSKNDIEFDVGVHYVGGNVFNKDKPLSVNRSVFDYITNGKLKWRKLDEIYDVAIISGKKFEIRSGKEKQIEDLKEWFPEEKDAIDRYWIEIENGAKYYSEYVSYSILSAYVPSFLSKMTKNVMTKNFFKYADKTTDQAMDEIGIKDNVLRALLTYDYGNYGLPPSSSTWANHCAVTSHYCNGAAYPIGGSSQFAKHIVQTILDHGGNAYVHAEVKSLLIENGKVCGVQVGNKILKSKYVVSACGAWNTFNKLIPKNLSPNLTAIADICDRLPQSPAHIILFAELHGSNEELNLPAANIWVEHSIDFNESAKEYAEDKSEIGGGASNYNRNFPAVFISFPSAKDPITWKKKYPQISVAEIVVTAEYEWFQEWASQPSKNRDSSYIDLKKKIGEKMLNVMYNEFPQLKDKVYSYDVGTPLTSEFNLGSHKGVSYGFGCTPEKFRCDFLKPSIDDLPNLYLTGQDIISEGIQGALMSGVMTAGCVSFKTLQTIRTLMNPSSSSTSTEDENNLSVKEEDDLEFEIE